MANDAREKAKRLTARGASAQEIRQATGLSGEAVRSIIQNNTQAPQQPGPTYQNKPLQPGVTYQLNDAGDQVVGIAETQINPAAANPDKSSSVRGSLKIAGEGGITRQELNNITDTTGKSAATVIKQLDKVNSNLKDADSARIRLNSGAANMLIKQSGPAYGGFYGLTQKPTFGTGNIGKALEGMRGTRPSGGYTNPQSGHSMATPGTAPTLMMGGTQIRGGGRPTVKGFGKQYKYTPGGTNTGTGDDGTGTNGTGSAGTELPSTSNTIDNLSDEPPKPTFQSANNTDLSGNAKGWRGRKSSWKAGGRATKGTGNLKINQAGNAAGVGLNVGIGFR